MLFLSKKKHRSGQKAKELKKRMMKKKKKKQQQKQQQLDDAKGMQQLVEQHQDYMHELVYHSDDDDDDEHDQEVDADDDGSEGVPNSISIADDDDDDDDDQVGADDADEPQSRVAVAPDTPPTPTVAPMAAATEPTLLLPYLETAADGSGSSAQPAIAIAALTPSLVDELMQPFFAANWTQHWTSRIGGSKRPDEADALLRVVVKFLYRVFVAADAKAADAKAVPNMLDFFLSLVSSRRQRLAFQLVCDDWNLSTSTLRGHLYQLLEASRWLARQPVALGYKRFGRGLIEFTNLVQSNLKGLKKSLTKEDQSKDKTVETMVFNRRHPVGGLPELQQVLMVDVASYQQLTSPPVVDIYSYTALLQCLAASFFTTAPNGRQGGIQTLQLLHLPDLEELGVACSSKFKTQSSLHYQPVLLSVQSKILLAVYLRYFRPAVLSPHHVPDREDPLFLNFDGRPLLDLGRVVTAYFRRKLGLTLTTTTLRGMLETAAAAALRAGTITTGQRASVAAVNGHSLSMATTAYVRNNRRDDATYAMQAFSLLKDNLLPASGLVAAVPVGGDDGAAAPPLSLSLPAFPSQEDWGLTHPDRSSVGKARWTDAEKDYIEEAASALLLENASLYGPKLMSAVLRRIRADKSTRAIFHARHVLDAGRLRSGWRKKRVSHGVPE